MLKKLAEFFTPPVFPDEEKTRQARILYTIQLVLVAAAFFAVLSSLRLGMLSAMRGILAATLIIVATYVFTRLGYLNLVNWLMLLGLVAAITFTVSQGQGIHDIAMLLFPLVIITASLLFERVAFTILNLIVFAALSWLVYSEVNGQIVTSFTSVTDYGDLAFLAIEQMLIAIITRMLARSLTSSLNRARHNESILAETNRRLEEQARSLRDSQELLAEAQRIGNIGHFVLDLSNNHLTWSDQMYRIHGLEPGQISITAESAAFFTVPEDRQDEAAARQKLLQTGQVVKTHRLLTFAGKVRDAITTTTLLRDPAGNPAAIIGTVQDVTERIQAEVRLEHYARRLEILRELDFAILRARSFDETALAAIDRLRELLPCWRVSFTTFDFSTNLVTIRAYSERDLAAQTVHVHMPLAHFMDIPTLQRGQPAYSDYLSALSETKPSTQRLLEEGTRSVLSLPVMITQQGQQELIGSINLEAEQPAAFTAEHIEIGQEVAGLLGIAFQQAQLLDETTEALEREKRLNTVAHIISGTLDMPTLLQDTMKLATEIVSANAGTLSLVSDEGDQIVDTYDWNIPAPLSGKALPPGKGLTWTIIESGQPLILDEYASHPKALPELVANGMHGLVGVPLIAGQACLGSLILLTSNPSKKFSQREMAALVSIGRQAGVAVQNARLYSNLQQELTERLHAEAALRQREAILSAVTFAAEKFLMTSDWRENIQQVLARLGEETSASHAYILENIQRPGGQIEQYRQYSWASAGIPAHQEDVLLASELEKRSLVLQTGEPFQTTQSQYLPEEAAIWTSQGILSLLEVPIFVGDQWWGVIGFDDCQRERQWTAAEIDALKVAAGIIRAAIQRQKADYATREREELYRRAISAADAVPYYQDYASQTYPFMGEGIQHLVGYPADQITPQFWMLLIEEVIVLGEGKGLSHQEAIRRARRGDFNIWRSDFRIHTRSGESRWIADAAVELYGSDGSAYGSIGILQDITDRKRSEEEARQLNVILEQRVRERTTELEASNRELEAFSYSVSHDLRAPLRGIDGYSKLLVEDYQDVISPEGQNYLRNIRSAAQKMGQLIDDLLLLSRVTRAEMHRELVNLSALAEEVVASLREQEPARTVQVSIQSEMNTLGDANLLRIMLRNLLSNAWKFTGKTGQPVIEVGAQQQEAGLVFFVRDNGAGFNMKYAHRLFTAFQRLHNPEDFEGTGIGLATVQRVISRHGGKIWVEAEEDKGATFYFTLAQ